MSDIFSEYQYIYPYLLLMLILGLGKKFNILDDRFFLI